MSQHFDNKELMKAHAQNKDATVTKKKKARRNKQKKTQKKTFDPFKQNKKYKGTHILTREVVDYDTTDEMDELLIPPSFQHKLIHGEPPPAITKLRSWQHGLLSRTEWKRGKSCVVVSPTSGGKTLIAEIAIAQLMDDCPNSRIIYSLPFVALAMEKYCEFKARFSQYNVRPFFQNMGGDFRNGTIAICTYEKTHSLINQAIKGCYFDTIKLVIIDEIHMIGDESRGIVAESLMMKMRMTVTKPRVIALTATVNISDARKIANCIGGFYHFCQQRSAELREYISVAGSGALFRIKKIPKDASGNENESECTKIAAQRSIPEDRDNILPLIKPLLARSNGQSLLVFVNTRNEAKRIALFIVNNIEKQIPNCQELVPPSNAVIKARESLISELAKCSTGLDKVLAGCIMKGIAYHHAGLLLEERHVVERGIQEGSINLIVATTTLSAGVNIRSVSRVIVYSAYRKNFNGPTSNARTMISPSLLAQMAGRSGRTETSSGDVIVIARNDKELNEIRELYLKPIPGITSSITNGGDVMSYLLQTLSLKLSNGVGSMREFINYSFAFQKEAAADPNQIYQPSNDENGNINHALVNDAVDDLVKNGLIDEHTFCTTQLGNAISSANLTVTEGLKLNKSILKVMRTLCLSDSLHLLFLCIPTYTGIYIPSFTEGVWETIFNKHSHVINLITDKNARELQRIIIQSYNGRTVSKDEQKEFERIFAGCILERLIEECSLQEIEKTFMVERGTIQILQTSSASFAGQATKFADEMGYSILSAALTRFRKRLEFGVKEELIDLMSIPSCSREIARELFNKGVHNAQDCADISTKVILECVTAGRGGEGSGLSEEDLKLISKNISKQAKQLAAHQALLDQYAENAAINFADAQSL